MSFGRTRDFRRSCARWASAIERRDQGRSSFLAPRALPCWPCAGRQAGVYSPAVQIPNFNVPLLNSEQMYQALQSLDVPTQLVIYPGQFHGFTKPSYILDRYQRYLAWYAKYIPAAKSGTAATN